MNLDAPNKSLVVRLDSVPDQPVTVIADGEVFTYVADSTRSVKPFNVPMKLVDNLPITLVEGPPDSDTKIEISVIRIQNPNTGNVRFWLIEKVDGTLYPYKGITLSPGDNHEELRAGSQTLDACGNLKVVAGTCTGVDPSFFANASFVLSGAIEVGGDLSLVYTPGSPPAPPPPPPPPGSDCADAIELTTNTELVDSAVHPAERWYHWTAPAGPVASIQVACTAGTSFEWVLYSACDDDAPINEGIVPNGGSSCVNVATGQDWWILVIPSFGTVSYSIEGRDIACGG